MTTFRALLIGGGLAAFGGLLSTWLTNWLGVKRDQRKYQHERDMALEVRRQERLREAYIELLKYLSHHAEWAVSLQPLPRPFPTPIPKAPDPMPRAEVHRVTALVEAYGSPEVRKLLNGWREWAEKLSEADEIVSDALERRQPGQELDAEARDEHVAMPPYREAMLQAEEAIKERVRQELAGEV
jgi:hypothetical protein